MTSEQLNCLPLLFAAASYNLKKTGSSVADVLQMRGLAALPLQVSKKPMCSASDFTGTSIPWLVKLFSRW